MADSDHSVSSSRETSSVENLVRFDPTEAEIGSQERQFGGPGLGPAAREELQRQGASAEDAQQARQDCPYRALLSSLRRAWQDR
ncbi:hypothetical protein TIFTF001_039057 [Ficus carica]|nr:hypothetical protein TIFTF001_039057 [Ficus carica]